MKTSIVAILLCYCCAGGCGKTVSGVPSAEPSLPLSQQEGREGVSMEVILLASMTDQVRAGQTAWAMLSLKNCSGSSVHLRPGGMRGKGGLEAKVPKPGFCSRQYYAGFALPDMFCEFVDSKGVVVHSVKLDPPDAKTLAPGESTELWRQVQLPAEGGVYDMVIRYDDGPMVWGLLTNDIIIGPTIKIECVVKGIEVGNR